ncbi:arsenic resistance protein [Bacillus lacus]|uniref:Arsenic resistance protein n=1 Tax=Metabacillus lacus TaxID=1983721 RepID=A0A7X2J238_9BACI|nr:bile acid:sodium symporter [Metabacillus lacus]MRX73950.1 arsenic resistance protein [Metabacillus lacus]
MNILEKLYTLIIFVAVIAGLAAGQFAALGRAAEYSILPLMVCMLYFTFLHIPLSEIGHSFKNAAFTMTSLVLNFVWTPFFAWVLGALFFSDQPALYIGFFLLMVTPCTDWYLIFTGIAKGNVALSAAILPLNLVLQVLLLPVYLLIFGGGTGMVEVMAVLEGTVLILLLPLAAAALTRYFFKRSSRSQERFFSKLNGMPILFLSLAIFAMFAAQGEMLLNNVHLILMMLPPIALFFLSNFFIGQTAGRIFGFSNRETASLSLTIMARNSPVALALALAAFPDQPLIPLVLVIGPLLELPILAAASSVMVYKNKHRSF